MKNDAVVYMVMSTSGPFLSKTRLHSVAISLALHMSLKDELWLAVRTILFSFLILININAPMQWQAGPGGPFEEIAVPELDAVATGEEAKEEK